MAFWDGTRWVPETAPAPRRREPGWLKGVSLVTMIVVLAGMLVPFSLLVAADSPGRAIRLSPESGDAGTLVTLTGSGFSRGTRVQVTWDGDATGLPTATANRLGTFTTAFKVPKATAGEHAVAAVSLSNARPWRLVAAVRTTLASATFAVLDSTGGGLAPAADPPENPTPKPSATDPAKTPPPPTATPTDTPPEATPKPTAKPDPTAPDPTPKPDPTDPPSSGEVVKTFGPSLKASTLEAAASDMDIDVIELTSGTYKLGDSVYFDVDRTNRPLKIRPASGATVIFAGSGSATEGGQFFFGLNKRAKWIKMSGFTFDGYLLAQAGIFELRQSSQVTLTGMTIRDITRDTSHSDKAYKTWAAYISRSNTDVLASGWKIIGSGRDWSGIQIDSGTSASDIHLINMTMSNLDYAFYENVPTTGLVLDGWTVTGCGENGTAISFHEASGVYKNMTGNSSGGINVNGSGMKSGGGIDW